MENHAIFFLLRYISQNLTIQTQYDRTSALLHYRVLLYQIRKKNNREKFRSFFLIQHRYIQFEHVQDRSLE